MAKKSKNDPLAVDTYLATLPRAERESLEALRTLIKDGCDEHQHFRYGDSATASGQTRVGATPARTSDQTE